MRVNATVAVLGYITALEVEGSLKNLDYPFLRFVGLGIL